MIPTAIALMVCTIAAEMFFLPAVKRNLTTFSRAWLRAIRATMVMIVILLTLVAVWAFLDWAGHGFPHSHARDFTDLCFVAGALLFTDVMWPRAWLNDRIEGLRVFAVAVEDRPDWKEPTHGR